MQVILLEKVGNLGNLGDVVKVKDGYARNFLIPQRMARRATAAAIEEFEARRAELEKAAAEKLANAQAQGEKLEGLTVQILQKSGSRWSSVRFRHQLRYRRSTDQTGFRHPQGTGSFAARSIQDRGRLPCFHRTAFRRRCRYYGFRTWRTRLIGSHSLSKSRVYPGIFCSCRFKRPSPLLIRHIPTNSIARFSGTRTPAFRTKNAIR